MRTPLIVRWPRRVAGAGEIRPQFCHAVDLMPTILEAAGVEAPETIDGVTQQPLDGASLLPVLADPAAPAPRRTQYFEMLGSRAIYHDGWKATTDHVGPQLTVELERVAGSHDFDKDHWALFDLEKDFAEAHDVGAQNPERLKALTELWWAEAGRNNVLPVTDSFLGRVTALEPSPWGPRWRAVLRPGGGPVSEDALPPLGGGFRLLAEVEVGAGAAGVLCALGDWSNGWAWYLLDGVPVLVFNILGEVFRYAVGPAPGRRPARAGDRVRLGREDEPHEARRRRRASSPRGRCRGACRCAGRSAAPACSSAATAASRSATTTGRRSRSRARSSAW